MIRWLICSIFLLASAGFATACSFTPYGEDTRYHLLDPAAFGYADLRWFSYNSGVYDGYPVERELWANTSEPFDANVLQWQAYCRNAVLPDAIRDAVYTIPYHDMERGDGRNAMLRYLREVGDTAALAYLRFAKSCEHFNAFESDPWERQQPDTALQIRAIENALHHASRELNPELRRRYAFLALRMIFYFGGRYRIAPVYRRFFAGTPVTTAIDHYALYFRAVAEQDTALQNYQLAKVFSKVPEKRFAVRMIYNFRTPPALALRFATNDSERAAILMMHGFRNPGRALESLRSVDALTPRARLLDFMLLRELSKLEDWIYTPTYTYFEPSVGHFFKDRQATSREALQRVASDRVYAATLRAFVRSRPASTRANPVLWETADAYLAAMSGDSKTALARLDRIRRAQYKGEANVDRQLQMLRTLWTIGTSALGKARVPVASEGLIQDAKTKRENRFLFAVGRELEMKGETSDAAALYAHLNDGYSFWNDYSDKKVVFWRTPSNHQTLYDDTYNNYFFYLDAQYSPQALQELLGEAARISAQDSFRQWLYAPVIAARDRLYDQLGTKHIRRNELSAALVAFRKVNDSLYTSKHRPFSTYLDANPFYADMYSEHTRLKADTIRFTKGAITARLINYLARAADPRDPDRSRYYFLAANCYLNMTQHGNSWMMRRYYWSTDTGPSQLEDETEYQEANLAAHYYHKARQYSRDRGFAALCLRMGVRCEKYRLAHRWESKSSENRWARAPDAWLARNNRARAELYRAYPEYADELINHCTAFEDYYARGW